MRAVIVTWGLIVATVAVLSVFGRREPRRFDPLARAAAAGPVANREAVVPPACYARTDNGANSCWTCHTDGRLPNAQSDWELQKEYSFSDTAKVNHWLNALPERAEARAAAAARISDTEILAWIRQDNYTPLRTELEGRADYPGFVPDLDLFGSDADGLVFDDDGFAVDGTGWRALRYKPFPGFWAAGGSSGDVMIRLPAPFRTRPDGEDSRKVYMANLAILEAAILADPRAATVELPATYTGAAAAIPVRRYLFPEGTEFLHTVRYLDPDQPGFLSRRLKELRYARKVRSLDDWAILRAYEKEQDEKDEGNLPRFAGSPKVGLVNELGWQLQGFIEDEKGRLRLQTSEEHLFCMGCHSNLGVTVDQTFSFARKLPGAAGWRHQDATDLPDPPQVGHTTSETLQYLERARLTDDPAALFAPSRERALFLDKAYRVLVREQRFEWGRDAVTPLPLHPRIDEESTGLAALGRVYLDGRLWLAWPEGE